MASKSIESQMAAPPAPAESQQPTLPHLECVDRVAKLPLVEAALAQSAGLYERVKGSHGLVNWTLSTAEGAAKKALEMAVPIASPIAIKLQQPIHAVDQTLCRGLDAVETRMPIIKEPPQQVGGEIYDSALEKVSTVKTYGSNKAHSLADLSWQKANEVLTTRYGNMAYTGFDSTANVAEKYFDYYFPPTQAEQQATAGEEENSPANEEDTADRVSHTVHTVGRLSNKMARRVYDSVSTQVRSLDKTKVNEYVHTLVALLTLTTYINALQRAGKGTGEQATAKQEQPSTSVVAQCIIAQKS